MSSLATAVMGGSSSCFLTRSVSLADLVFNDISCSREIPQKAIGLNLFTPDYT